MKKELLPINRFLSRITFDGEYKNSQQKIDEFSGYIREKTSNVFLWKKVKENEKIYVCESAIRCIEEAMDKADDLFIDYDSLEEVSNAIQNTIETKEVSTTTIRVYQKSLGSVEPIWEIATTAAAGKQENIDTEGIVEIIELRNEIEDYKNIVNKNVHDIKNQMMLMLSMANNIQYETDDSDIKKYAYFIKDTLYSCNYMLTLMSMDEKQEIISTLFNTHHVIKTLIDSFRCETNIEFIDELNADNPRIYANKVLITNAIYNLFINAIQALEHDGRITVRTYNKQENTASDYEWNEWLFIDITDNGSGIEEKDRDKIFNQFFTTKINGSGIGLYSAQMTINKYRGSISAKSQKDGATFTVCLPCHLE